MRRATTVALAALLYGCAATGVRVTEDQAAALKPGATTESEVVQRFGPPTMRMRQADGTLLLIYSHAEAQVRPATFIPLIGGLVGGSDVRSTTVTLRFDGNGRLIDTTSATSAYGTGPGGAVEPVPDQPRR
jgi:outer membrane protein assembly factor BamE (lipoprotein component of BamABCDE complex)